MENNDPFASLAELCQISSSQEDCLCRSCFAGEAQPEESNSCDDKDDSGDVHVETTPIEILSAPESPEEKENDGCGQQDQFHTPPERSLLACTQGQQLVHHGHVAGLQLMAVDSDCTDISKAVDLGRDIDLGFSEEVELAQKRESASIGDSSRAVVGVQQNEVIHSESNIIRISNTQSSLNVGLTDLPMKRSALVTKNLGLDTMTGKSVEKVAKSTEKLRSEAQNPKISEKDKDLENPRACLGTEPVRSVDVLTNWTWKFITRSGSPETSQCLGLESRNAHFCNESRKSKKSSIKSTLKPTSPLKELENLGGNLNLVTPKAHLGTNREEVKEISVDSLEKLRSDVATPQYDNSIALQNHHFGEPMLIDNSNDGENAHRKSSAKKKRKFPAAAIRSEVEGAGGNSGFGEGVVNGSRNEVDSEVSRMCSHGKRGSCSKNFDDFNGCRSARPSIAKSLGMRMIAERKRELPSSITCGSVQNEQRNNQSGILSPKDNPWEYPILYTLRELEKYSLSGYCS